MNHPKVSTAVLGTLLVTAAAGHAADLPLDGLVSVIDLEPSGGGLAHGADVAVSGGLAVVGRPGEGVVDVYRRQATGPTLDGLPWAWSWYGRLEPEGVAPGSGFGSSVAIAGQTIVVGAWKDDNAGTNAGAAWAFEVEADGQDWESVDTWSLGPLVGTGEPGTGLHESDYFGWDVAVGGGTVAIGCWGDDTDGDHAGAVHLFQRATDGFDYVAKVTPGEAEVGARFGSSVALADEQLFVGAPARSGWSGSAYLFDGSADHWAFVQRLDSPEGHAWERFGHALACVTESDGDVIGIVVGAPGDGELGSQAGCVYIFVPIEGEGGGLFEPYDAPKVVAPGGGPMERVGTSLSAFLAYDQAGSDDGGGLLIGAPGWRHPEDGEEHGAVYFIAFDELEGGQEESGRVLIPSEPGGGLGSCVAADVSPVTGSDGFSAATVLVGMPAAAAGFGRTQLVDVPVQELSDGDCDANGYFDPMEVHFFPESTDCDGDGEHDACQLLQGGVDCNSDGVLDECQLGPETDCDSDGVLDECQLGPETDCQGDGVLDVCQLDSETDCDGDSVLDECQLGPETDCNGDEFLDVCQLGPETDCDSDGVLDECQLGPETDCNGDGFLDVCQLSPATDCDGNGVLDECEEHGPADCDMNGLPDVCELDGASDCDGNGVLDVCETGLPDCDQDGVPDACQLDAATDCNGDGLLDVCQVDAVTDCDANGALDVCEIAADPAVDCDGDGVLDACQIPDGSVIPPDWLTQQFVSGIDLAGLGVRLNPTGNSTPPYYQLCTVMAGEVWVDPFSHTPQVLLDDDAVLMQLPFSFDYAGTLQHELYVGSNGNVTFDQPDTTYIETLVGHFAIPRLSVLFDDLDPEAGGSVLVGLGPAGSFVVTWLNLPEYLIPGTDNTAQLVLHPDGAVEMSWISMTSTTAIAGPSAGTGMGPDFVMTDLSNAWDCVARSPVAAGDCDGNGVPDACQGPPAGDPWWGTEHFTGDFDLNNTKLTFTPQESPLPNSWSVCSTPISMFPVDPYGAGTVVPLTDDGSYQVSTGVVFPFAGTDWTDAFINANGSISFMYGDSGYDGTLANHFYQPRVAGLLTDLNPEVAGEVRYQYGPDGGLVVSWLGVSVYGWTEFDVDMQILLHPDGVAEVAFLAADPFDAVVGVSEGLGVPINFAQTDLSASGVACDLVQPFDDCDGSSVMDTIEIAIGCLSDYDLNGIPDVCESGGLQGLAPPCPWDVTGDGAVNVHDLLSLLEHWGEAKLGSPSERFDLSPPKGDRSVDVADLVEMIQGMQYGCGQP